ncbi:unnamed protein product, partial [Pleuronectes platessa]
MAAVMHRLLRQTQAEPPIQRPAALYPPPTHTSKLSSLFVVVQRQMAPEPPSHSHLLRDKLAASELVGITPVQMKNETEETAFTASWDPSTQCHMGLLGVRGLLSLDVASRQKLSRSGIAGAHPLGQGGTWECVQVVCVGSPAFMLPGPSVSLQPTLIKQSIVHLFRNLSRNPRSRGSATRPERTASCSVA